MKPPVYLPKWVTADFLEESRALWSRKYGRELTTEETCEIILNVAKLVDVLQGNEP